MIQVVTNRPFLRVGCHRRQHAARSGEFKERESVCVRERESGGGARAREKVGTGAGY
jgi:hypothetical protein